MQVEDRIIHQPVQYINHPSTYFCCQSHNCRINVGPHVAKNPPSNSKPQVPKTNQAPQTSDNSQDDWIVVTNKGSNISRQMQHQAMSQTITSTYSTRIFSQATPMAPKEQALVLRALNLSAMQTCKPGHHHLYCPCMQSLLCNKAKCLYRNQGQ